MIRLLHRGDIPPLCEHTEDQSHFPKAPLQHILRALRQPADGVDPNGPQFFGGGRPHIEQVLHRQGVDDLLVVILLDPGDGVRLFVVAPQFGGDLVVGHADAGRDAQFRLDPAADLPGDGHGGAVQPHAARHIQPVLIQAKRLHLVGVVLVDLSGIAADANILVHVGGQGNKLGATLFCLPDGHAGFDAVGLGDIIRGEYDAVPLLLAPTHRQRRVPQFRVALHLDAGVEAVHITV